MSPVPAYRAKRDENEPIIRRAFVACRWATVQLSQRGVWDLFAYDPRSPFHYAWIEVKGPDGELTEAQEEWARQHPSLPKFIARDEADVFRIVAQIEDASRAGGGSWQGLEDQEAKR